MEITWYGQTCFRLRANKVTLLSDPVTGLLDKRRFQVDIVTNSELMPDNRAPFVQNEFKVIDGPGEYEVADVFVTGVYLPPSRKSQSTTRNNVFVVYMEDMILCHLGNLNHVPTQQQVEDLGGIEVLMVPVGGHSALNAAQAADVISLVEPQIVIPMNYQLPEISDPEVANFEPVDKFLKEMGLTNVETIDSLKITKSQLPEETQIVLLAPKG